MQFRVESSISTLTFNFNNNNVNKILSQILKLNEPQAKQSL